MVPNLGKEEPPAARRGTRRRPGRESALVWWALFAAVFGAAYWFQSWRVALLGLLGWCLYEFMLVPTMCRILTQQGAACTERTRGGCSPAPAPATSGSATTRCGASRASATPSRSRCPPRNPTATPASWSSPRTCADASSRRTGPSSCSPPPHGRGARRHGLRVPVARPPVARRAGQTSRTRVIGPSLTSATFMSAPNSPVSTFAPMLRSSWTTASTRGSATGPGAAAVQDGRRPFRASP